MKNIAARVLLCWTLGFIAVSTCLSGCGQKSNLYLPEAKPAEPVEPAEQADSQKSYKKYPR